MSAPQPGSEISARIIERAARADVFVQPKLATKLAAYLTLLAKWNRTINLTALPLEPPTDEAIDRLIVEPVAAAAFVRPTDRVAVDIGSGGGSPAIPLNLAAPQLAFTLVEVKSRKSAFLREAGRQLEIPKLTVETTRAEELGGRPELRASANLVTIRAVRVDTELLHAMRFLLMSGGRIIWFGGAAESETLPAAERQGLEFERGQGTLVGTVVIRAK